MKLNLQKIIGYGSVALAALTPLATHAAFSGGMIIPSGTATAVAENAETYFFTPILATVFQSQMIQILLILGAIMVMWALVRYLWRKFHSPAR